MTENEYLEMPWSIEDTIENLKTIEEHLIATVLKANLDGKGKQDAREVEFDFNRAIQALEEIQQYRAIGKVEEIKYLVDSYNGMIHDFGDDMCELKQYRAIGTVEECQNNKVLADKRYEHFFDGMEQLEKYKAIGTIEEFKMLKDHLWTFNEICKDYSAIGTVEEFKRAKEMEAVYGQVKWERDIAISQLEEIGVGLGQKMDEFKDLKEKSIAEKAEWKFDDFTAKFGNPYRCSNCDEEFEDTYNYCPNCGCDMYAD